MEDLTSAFSVPGAAAGAITVTQFIKVFWSSAQATQLKAIAALSGLGLVSGIQWDVFQSGEALAIAGVVLSGLTAGLGATAAFDLAKERFVNS